MKSLLVFASLVLATSLVHAQAPAAAPAATPTIGLPAAPVPAPAPTPERIEAAKVLMANMHFADTLNKVLDARKEQVVRLIEQSTMAMPAGSASPEDIAAYRADQIKTYTSVMSADAALKGMVTVYASLFTVDELKGMSDFYGSPAGQALVAKTIELQKMSGEVLQKQMQIVMPQLQAKQKAFVTAHPAKTAPSAAAPSAMAPVPAATPAPVPPASK